MQLPDSSLRQYTSHTVSTDGTHYLSRDPLGIGKLFYTYEKNAGLRVSSRFSDLLSPESSVYAAPRGSFVSIGADGSRTLLLTTQYDSSTWNDDVVGFQRTVTNRLAHAFTVIRQMELAGARIFVALSGGLDSSAIAYCAQRYLANPIACTLDLGRSEDAEKSALIAKTIGIRHEVFSTSREEILENVAISPAICQDYRDFNVHCAVINLILGRNIREYVDRESSGYDDVVVLTGDLMNEFTNDYAEEIVEDTVYYRLPRVRGKMLQRHLVGGLDTSDREISPFAHHGIVCIQPYAVLSDLYLALDAAHLEGDGAKQRLNSFMVPEEVLQHLPKSKLRAQVGDKETMGVLGICHREGIGEDRFLSQLLAGTGATREQIPITMGRYNTEKFEPM